MGLRLRRDRGDVESPFMDRASSLIFPGSRTIAGWWRQLSSYQPSALWVGYAYLHRVEASVHALVQKPLDHLSYLLLQAVTLEHGSRSNGNGVLAAHLESRLKVPIPVVTRLLRDLQSIGLIAGSPEVGWSPTDLGRHALPARSFSERGIARRILTFAERLDPSGRRVAPPHFAPIGECTGVPWQASESCPFDATHLKACVEQSAEWKLRFGFPHDVESLAADGTVESWRRVIVDRPERAMLAWVRTGAADASEVVAFGIKVDGWTLHDRTPALCMGSAASTVWPELDAEPPPAVLKEAWRSWCRQRQLPPNEVESCELSLQPARLDVRAPLRLIQRLQAARSDLFKGEAWILIGDGYIRSAVQLAVTSG